MQKVNDTAILEPGVLLSVMALSHLIDNLYLGLTICIGAAVLLFIGPLGRIAFKLSVVYRFWSTSATFFFVPAYIWVFSSDPDHSELRSIILYAFITWFVILYLIWWIWLRRILTDEND